MVFSRKSPNNDKNAKCDICDEKLSWCRRDLKSCHEEADNIAQLFKRFDNNLVQLKNPSQQELCRTIDEIVEKLGNRVLFLAFVGHGMQTSKGLGYVLADKCVVGVEQYCRDISKNSPVVAYFNCTRTMGTGIQSVPAQESTED